MRTSKQSNQENINSNLLKKVVFNKVWSTKTALAFPSGSALTLRNKCIDWLYAVDRTLYIARSTLYLAVGLLDKIITRSFSLDKNNWEVVAGSLLLLATKFNEVYPISARKLSGHSSVVHDLEAYEEVEAQILETVDFNLSTDSSIYEELAGFEAKFEGA